MSAKKKPYYGKRTQKQVLKEYFNSSASMNELSQLHGILGSNTVGDWIKKNEHLHPEKLSQKKKRVATMKEQQIRKKRYKTEQQIRIGELEKDLERAQQRVRFYTMALEVINDLAKELTQVDLLKKTGHELSVWSVNAK